MFIYNTEDKSTKDINFEQHKQMLQSVSSSYFVQIPIDKEYYTQHISYIGISLWKYISL